jgi:hypothetical protein
MRSAFRAADVAFAEQQQRQFIRGPKVVGLQRHQTRDQRRSGVTATLCLADLVQHGQGTRPIGRQFQHIDGQAFGLVELAGGVRLNRAFLHRGQLLTGLRRS